MVDAVCKRPQLCVLTPPYANMDYEYGLANVAKITAIDLIPWLSAERRRLFLGDCFGKVL
jgi:hypothetical protein